MLIPRLLFESSMRNTSAVRTMRTRILFLLLLFASDACKRSPINEQIYRGGYSTWIGNSNG